MTVTEIHHMFKRFMIRNQNQFTVTLSGDCPNTLTTISLYLSSKIQCHIDNINSEETAVGEI